MTRGTTPTLIFRITSDGIDLADMTQVWVTIRDQSHKLTKTIEDVEIEPAEGTISLALSQEDTLYFTNSMVEIQIRLLDDSGNAYATSVKTLPMNRILEGGVISDAD